MNGEFKISFKRINHITVAVPAGEEARVRAFYGGVLGLEEVPQDKSLQGHYTLIWYRLLAILLHLDFSPPWVTPAENRHVAIQVEDLKSGTRLPGIKERRNSSCRSDAGSKPFLSDRSFRNLFRVN